MCIRLDRHRGEIRETVRRLWNKTLLSGPHLCVSSLLLHQRSILCKVAFKSFKLLANMYNAPQRLLPLCKYLIRDLLCLVDFGHVASGLEWEAKLFCWERLEVFAVVLMGLSHVSSAQLPC